MPDASLPPAPPRPTAPRIGAAGLLRRLGDRLWFKIAGVTAWNVVFFAAYFELLRNPAFPVTTMPLTVVDDWVPFQPGMLAVYVSLWVYLGIAPSLLPRIRDILVYGAWAGALCAAGLVCFWLWPTAVPPLQPPDVAQHPGFGLLQGVDAAGNACPSMHVASAVFTAAWTDRLLARLGAAARWRWGSAAWCAAIVWSTMAVKQHVWLDVLGGLALAAVFAAVSWRATHHA